MVHYFIPSANDVYLQKAFCFLSLDTGQLNQGFCPGLSFVFCFILVVGSIVG